MELGTPTWLAAAREAVNTSDAYRRSAAGWRWDLGLAFLPDPPPTDGPARFGVLDLRDGECRGAVEVDRRTFERAPFRLSATYASWHRVLDEGADPMRCILLRELDMAGDRLTAIRYLPAAKALLDAVANVDTRVASG